MDFPYILRQSEAFLLREEWRSCSEVTLNELWRYDIKGNKWEPDTKDRRATGGVSMCFFYKHLLNQLENQVYLRIPTSLKQNISFKKPFWMRLSA